MPNPPKPFWKAFEISPEGIETVAKGQFLHLEKATIRNVYQDGAKSRWYPVETARTPFSDAVVLAIHLAPPRQNGDYLQTKVLLRRGPRPAAWFRSLLPEFMGMDSHPSAGDVWELPAGGVEPLDLEPGGGGIPGRAIAEAMEETGFRIGVEQLKPLGPPAFTAPAFSHEKLHYFATQVEEDQACEPPGDGHPLETGTELRFVSLKEAFRWCRAGIIIDLKTEVGLRRLADCLAFNQT